MKSNKGITLVSLIITIIVMLILVGVTVSIVINSSLFNTVKDAGQQYQQAAVTEQDVGINLGMGGEDIVAVLGDDYKADVNPPELLDGMIAVEWNGTNWVKANTDNTSWYAYGGTAAKKK